MRETLAEKTLKEGIKLSLIKYHLSPSEVKDLPNRPTDCSEEIVLDIDLNIGGKATYPTASWYIAKKTYEQLYEAIKTRKDFELVQKSLNNINSTTEAQKAIESIFEQL